ncbi:MAG: hypothetical protein CM1200mP22_23710 [Dehalococcoidia bacterium]|nr:MAG: hypothetical protein CM1200mP22_23710 [Dehalococcoidia bacterium]
MNSFSKGGITCRLQLLGTFTAQRRLLLRTYLERRYTFGPGLSDLLEAEVYLKHEEYLPLGAFKGRGGINLLANLVMRKKNVD